MSRTHVLEWHAWFKASRAATVASAAQCPTLLPTNKYNIKYFINANYKDKELPSKNQESIKLTVKIVIKCIFEKPIGILKQEQKNILKT